jgi:phosphoribosylformylglycinamidine cyclo-ligase
MGESYQAAGVDIGAGEAAVERIKAKVRSTYRPEVLGDIGGFGGLVSMPSGYHQPVLVSSTDGVGTKAMVARAAGRYDTIGLDLVAMCVDDIVCQGAEPLFFLDYISVGKLDPDQVDLLVTGVAEGCRQAGCALVGGEMAEHPGAMEPGEFDLVGFAVGMVEWSQLLPADVRPGDAVIGLASGGLRCNGYSLARRALLGVDGTDLDRPAWAGARHSLADELLRPSVIYAPSLLEVRRHVTVHAYAHITGGGIPGNLARVLPDSCDAVVHRGAWDRPRIFAEVQAAGAVADAEMEQVFNLGLGMLAVVPGDAVHAALDAVRSAGHDAWVVGEITPGHGRVTMTDDPPARTNN